jgi:Dolichyl-phosphate-mannose-protein mannosyltransferase
MRDAAAIFALNAAYCGIGVATLNALGLSRVVEPLVARVALAYVAGCITAGLGGLMLALAGIPLYPVVVLFARTTYPVFRLLKARGAPWRSVRPPRRGLPRGELMIVVLMALLSGILVVTTALRPLSETDGWAIWGLKAHALLVEGDASGLVFDGDAYARSHPEYPFLVPVLEAVFLRTLDGWNELAVDVPVALLTVATAFALWGLARRSAPGWLAALAALVIVGTPATVQQVTWNYVDVPLAMLVALGILCLAIGYDDAAFAWPRLASLFLIGAAYTKSEGAMFALFAFAAALLGSYGLPSVARRLTRPAVVTLGAVVVWHAVLALRDVHSSDFDLTRLLDASFLFERRDRVGDAASRLIAEIFGQSIFLATAAMFALVAGLLAGRGRVVCFYLAWAGMSVGALVAVYWISWWPLERHLDTSATRVVEAIVFTGASLAPLCVGSALTRAAALRRRVYTRSAEPVAEALTSRP